ncbi:DUF3300 domain-containing protein [Aliiglaciecola aliphaticivorans]
MKNNTKYVLVYLALISVIVTLAVNLAQAQEPEDVIVIESNANPDIDEAAQQSTYLLDQAELDQMLAPVALYPDTVLSHVLVASTYPLEVVQAARWREKNQSLSEEEVMEAIAEEDWDPSVKALVPFHQLLQQITEDLNWLQDLGDAFLINEEQVLASVQNLRHKAYEQGSLENNEYIEVVEEEENIVIQPASTEIVYVPYYDTRIVYGTWWWHEYPPIFWHRPAHYYRHAGLYWSPRVFVRHNLFWGGFNWRSRYIVVNNHPHRYGRRDDGVRRVTSSEYQRWQHNPTHRRGVRYDAHTPKVVYRQQNRNDNKRVISTGGKTRVLDKSRPVKVRNYDKTVKTNKKAQQTQQRLQSSKTKQYSNINDKSDRRQVSAQSRNTVVQRSQKGTQQSSQNKAYSKRQNNNVSANKSNAQRQSNNVSRDNVNSANRSRTNSNSNSVKRYSNKQSQGAQRSSRNYSSNKVNSRSSNNRTVHRQSSNKVQRKER